MKFAIAAIVLAAATTSGSAWAQSPAAEPSLVYTVQPSDKLIAMARDLLVDPKAWPEVARFNQLKDPNFIKPRQQIQIPLRLLKFQPSAGRIVSTSGDVRLGGTPATVGMNVPEGSRLQTSANSSVVVELGDGSQVKLLPNTLADVVNNRGYLMRDPGASASTTWFSGLIRLAQGALETAAQRIQKRAEPLQIQTPTSTVGVRGTQFRVAYEDPATRNSRTEVVKPQGLWPMPVLNGAEAFRVQVARDARFDQIVRDLRVTTASVDLSSLDNANWYARVRGIDSLGLEGFDSTKLIEVKAPPPPPPTRWRVVSATLSQRNGDNLLAWTAEQANGQPMVASAYSAEIGSDIGLTQGVRTLRATEPRLSLGLMAVGTYFVRLHATLPDGAVVDSGVYRMDISANWGVTVFDSGFPLVPMATR